MRVNWARSLPTAQFVDLRNGRHASWLPYTICLASPNKVTKCKSQKQGAVPLSSLATPPSGRAADTQSLPHAEVPRLGPAALLPFGDGTCIVPSPPSLQPYNATAAGRKPRSDLRLDEQMNDGNEYSSKQHGRGKLASAAPLLRSDSALASGHREAQQGDHPGSHEGSSLASTSSFKQTRAAAFKPQPSPAPTLLLSTPANAGEVESATARRTFLITDLICTSTQSLFVDRLQTLLQSHVKYPKTTTGLSNFVGAVTLLLKPSSLAITTDQGGSACLQEVLLFAGACENSSQIGKQRCRNSKSTRDPGLTTTRNGGLCARITCIKNRHSLECKETGYRSMCRDAWSAAPP